LNIQALVTFLTQYGLIIISVLFVATVILIILNMVNAIRYKQLYKYLEVTISQKTEQLEIQTKIARDRTRELEVQTKVAQIASQAKSDFLARISHEIRTPLNAIMGMTEIARKSTTFPKTLTSLDQITAASTHLLAILNDVLDMSKIESGKFVIVHEPFLLRVAMLEVANIIAPRCRSKQIHFLTNVRELPDAAVLGDKLRLKQVLINLLGNSVKFTPEEGKLALVVKIETETERAFTVTFRVTDSGIGMTEEQMAKIFKPFEQADNSIAARFGGTGLGLSISQNLVGQMTGQILVKSTPGKGSSFSFVIPLEKTEYTQEELKTEGDAMPDLTGKRILLVEDVEINRMILIELLEDTHVAIEEAEDGQKALDKFNASSLGYYDLIFMDIQMPNLDGYEATTRIRALDRADAKTVSIIAMTANAYREDIDKALSVGMNGHVAKPIDLNAVIRSLRERLLK
jgi:signal transduction histidine kinase/CheY-like chemotaxis protein